MEKSAKLNVILITGRTIEQGAGKEAGKQSKEYGESVSVCFMDPEDMQRLAIKEKTAVKVSTGSGSVIARAMKSLRGPHLGIIFIPYGPWANAIADSTTDSVGMPRLKGTPAIIEKAVNERVLSLKKLLTKQYGKE